MKSRTLPGFWKLYRKLPASIHKEARAAYRQFLNNPQHPGLHFHRLFNDQAIGRFASHSIIAPWALWRETRSRGSGLAVTRHSTGHSRNESRLVRGCFNFFNRRDEPMADVGEAMVVGDLGGGALIGDVEDIDDLVESRADLGGADGESELKERAGDGVEQAHFVVGKGGDDGVSLGGRVVDRNAGR